MSRTLYNVAELVKLIAQMLLVAYFITMSLPGFLSGFVVGGGRGDANIDFLSWRSLFFFILTGSGYKTLR